VRRIGGWLIELAMRQPDPIDECLFAAAGLGLLWLAGLRLGVGLR
jgi:hypothetical protein